MCLIYIVNYKQYEMTNDVLMSESGYDCRIRVHYPLNSTKIDTISIKLRVNVTRSCMHIYGLVAGNLCDAVKYEDFELMLGAK
jgi:hypothetical protein